MFSLDHLEVSDAITIMHTPILLCIHMYVLLKCVFSV